MFQKSISILPLIAVLLTISCKESKDNINIEPKTELSFKKEKEAILKTLNQETEAAFSRDYSGWKEKWIHEPFVTKTYIDYPKNHFTETLGWAEVDRFVKNYFEENPDPEPIPILLEDISLRLYGSAAWITYEQNDSIRGRKRETRLMEKVKGQWKIAVMQTTIYGFSN